VAWAIGSTIWLIVEKELAPLKAAVANALNELNPQLGIKIEINPSTGLAGLDWRRNNAEIWPNDYPSNLRDPPCMRQYPLSIAGPRHANPLRVKPLHLGTTAPVRMPSHLFTRRTKRAMSDSGAFGRDSGT
jgi:hypothetical protein